MIHLAKIQNYESNMGQLREYLFESGEFSRTRWREVYQTLDDSPAIEQLPLALSLIHPDFWDGEDFEKARILQPLAFKNSNVWKAEQNPSCIWWEILGACGECETELSVEADHKWPKSLGGLKANGNWQPLCELHNKMKGNSVLLFDWTTWPIWLGGLLREMNATYS